MFTVIYQHTKRHIHRYHDSFEADLRSKRGQWPNSRKSPAILQNSCNNLLIHWPMRLSIPIKPKNPVTWAFSPCERVHPLRSVCFPESTCFHFLWLILKVFPAKAKSIPLAPFQGHDLRCDYPLVSLFSFLKHLHVIQISSEII